MRPVIALALLAASVPATAQEKPAARQIAEAVSPLPASLQRGAMVLGFRGGQLAELRAGTNSMICLADDPTRSGFQAACYHEALEPFMARGRELRAEGKNSAERRTIRMAEVDAGRLSMPEGPAALYSLNAESDAFDPAAGGGGAARLYVLYIPYATEESTGISSVPAGDRPWLMGGGTAWAHIMYRR